MMWPLFIFLALPADVTAFTNHAPTVCRYSAIPHSSALHASKKRSGAMARRKKKSSSSDGKGVDAKAEDEESTSSSSEPGSIYSMPPLYDLAFGYRRYEDEVDFLLDAHDKYSKQTSPNNNDAEDEGLRIIELAAGPARHCLAALSEHPPSEVHSVTALDLSPDMVNYGMENADHELGAPGGRRDGFIYINGDMRKVDEYAEAKSFDTAWLLLGSMQHLLTNDDIIACFTSLRSVMKDGGIAVIELPHPRETFSMGECTRNGWTVPLVEDDEDGGEKEYGELNIVWGEENDEFDPVAQIRRFTVGLELTINDVNDIPEDESTSPLFAQMSKEGKTEVKEIVPMRLFTLQEIDALARCAGFELVAKYGALDEEVSIEMEEEAFRMVCILRKIA